MRLKLSPLRLFLSFLLLSAILSFVYFWGPFLPSYTFSGNSISRGDLKYVSGVKEFDLVASSLGKKIGKTEEGFSIYEITGQNSEDWVVVRGFMFPDVVFRNARIRPVDMRQFGIDEIHIIPSKEPNLPLVVTKDKVLVDSIIRSFEHEEVTVGSKDNYRSFEIRLLSKDFEGIGFFIYGFLDRQGNVFVAKRVDPESWYKPSKEFESWVRSQEI